MIALLLTAIVTTTMWHGGPRGSQDAAALIPHDVDLVVSIDETADLADAVDRYAIGSVVDDLLSRLAVSEAWAALARSTGTTEQILFRTMLGGDVMIALRHPAEKPTQWVVISEVNDESWAWFASRTRPRVLASPWGVPVRRLPEQELSFVRKGNLLIISPELAERGTLLGDVMGLLLEDNRRSLRDDDEVRRAHGIARGDVRIFMRHARPLGGFSVVSFDLDGEDAVCRVRLIGRYDDSPVRRGQPTDFARPMIDQLGEVSDLVVAMPARLPAEPLGSFLRSQLPAFANLARVAEAVDDRMVVLLRADAEGAVDASLVLEAKSLAPRMADFDRCVALTVDKLHQRLDPNLAPVDLTPYQDLPHDAVRSIEWTTAARAFGLGDGDEAPALLSWRGVQLDEHAWLVVATDRVWMDEIIRRIRASSADDGDVLTISNQYSIMRAPALAAPIERLLASIGANDDLLREERARLTTILRTTGMVFRAMERVTWVIRSDGANDVRVDVRAELKPAK